MKSTEWGTQTRQLAARSTEWGAVARSTEWG
jgi:hypothetical protein